MNYLEQRSPVAVRPPEVQGKGVIVLGASDPLGRHVTRALIASGHSVTVASLDDAHESIGASRRAISLQDPDTLRSAVVSHDAVVNLEPVIREPRSTLSALLDRRRRRRLARQLINLSRAFAAAPATRWVQRSTPAVYRDGGDQWLDEKWPTKTNPSTALAHHAEQAVGEHVRGGGTGVVLRMPRPYAPDDSWTCEILRLARNGWQPFEGPDWAFVPTVSVIDATAAVLAALAAPAGTYNVADSVPATNRQLNDLLGAVTGQRTLQPLYSSYSRADRDLLARSHRLDVSALKNAAGWRPRFGPSELASIPSA